VTSPEIWVEMHDILNLIAHDYLPEQLVSIFEAIRTRFLVEIIFCFDESRKLTSES
jgi:hypothetical protein